MADLHSRRAGGGDCSGAVGDAGGWRKSVSSNANGNCVEVLIGGETVGVRDSKNPHLALLIGRAAWRAFVIALRPDTDHFALRGGPPDG